MAILWCDSFNSYGTTSDMTKAYGSNDDSVALTINLTGGPDSSPCLQMASGSDSLRGTLYGAVASTILGGRFRFKATTRGGSTVEILAIGTQTNTGIITGSWYLGASATTGVAYLTLGNGVPVTALASGSTDICDGSWHVLEFQVDLKDSGGTAKLWVDGVLECNFSGDTFNATAHPTAPWRSTATSFSLTGPVSTGVRSIDDLVIFDSAGVSGNLRTADQPFGNIVIATLRPSGAGTTTQFTPSAGSNFQCVDETAQDGNTSYVEDTVSGHRDLYAMGNLGLSPTTVYGVVAKVFATNPGSLSISMKQTLKSGATTTANTATVTNLIGDYKTQVYDLDPDINAVWTGTTVDAVEQGFEVA